MTFAEKFLLWIFSELVGHFGVAFHSSRSFKNNFLQDQQSPEERLSFKINAFTRTMTRSGLKDNWMTIVGGMGVGSSIVVDSESGSDIDRSLAEQTLPECLGLRKVESKLEWTLGLWFVSISVPGSSVLLIMIGGIVRIPTAMGILTFGSKFEALNGSNKERRTFWVL